MPRPRKGIVKRPKGSKIWHYDWTIDGHRFRGSCETEQRAAAEAIALNKRKELIAKLARGEPLVEESPPRDLTLDDAAGMFLAEHAQFLPSAPAIESRSNVLLRVIGRRTLIKTIDTATGRDFIAKRRREVTMFGDRPADATIDLEIAQLCRILSHIRQRHKRVAVGSVDLGELRKGLQKSPPKEVFLTHEQFSDLMDAARPHAVPVMLFLLYTGFRRATATLVDWDLNISLSPHARATVTTKGGRRHTVPLITEAVELLMRLEPDPKLRHGPVFWYGNPAIGCTCKACKAGARVYRQTGHRRPIRDIRHAWVDARGIVGLDHVRIHDIRHTAASWVLAQNNSLKVVQKMLGHSRITTTARYAHLETGALANAMDESLSLSPRRKKAPARRVK